MSADSLTPTPHRLPDPDRVRACQADPARGPRILLFTGGTGARGLSRALTSYTHNSIHLVSTFDSGGSSALLRDAFDMPAVGDLRNRLLALAGDDADADVCRVLSHRLPTAARRDQLAASMQQLASGEHPSYGGVPPRSRSRITRLLAIVSEQLPADFDLRGASVGNLVLTAMYLEHGRDLGAALAELARMVDARGQVRAIASVAADLSGRLANGEVVMGQHLLTSKGGRPLPARIESVEVVGRDGQPVRADPEICELIASADLICYPTGSFHTSLCATLLPLGVRDAIRQSAALKVYVPNTGVDPEQAGYSLVDCCRRLLRVLGGRPPHPAPELLGVVLLDDAPRSYDVRLDLEEVAELGIEVLRRDLVDVGAVQLDDVRLAELLISLT